jgi:hypothetical protein
VRRHVRRFSIIKVFSESWKSCKYVFIVFDWLCRLRRFDNFQLVLWQNLRLVGMSFFGEVLGNYGPFGIALLAAKGVGDGCAYRVKEVFDQTLFLICKINVSFRVKYWAFEFRK